MAEINLLKNELKEGKGFTMGKKSLASLYLVLGILAFELLVYAGMFAFAGRLVGQAKKAEQQGASVNFEISKIDKDRMEAISVQRRLANLEVLLENHVFWTPVFQELEKFTYQAARYETLQVQQAENKLILSGVIPSYTDLGKLILGLEESENFKEAVLQSSSQTEGLEAGYVFNLEVRFDPKLLKR